MLSQLANQHLAKQPIGLDLVASHYQAGTELGLSLVIPSGAARPRLRTSPSLSYAKKAWHGLRQGAARLFTMFT